MAQGIKTKRKEDDLKLFFDVKFETVSFSFQFNFAVSTFAKRRKARKRLPPKTWARLSSGKGSDLHPTRLDLSFRPDVELAPLEERAYFKALGREL